MCEVVSSSTSASTESFATTLSGWTRLRRLFAGHGWEHDRIRTILEPVPWTRDLLEAHVDVVRDYAADLPDDLAELLVERADRLVAEIGTEEVGEMCSLAMGFPES